MNKRTGILNALLLVAVFALPTFAQIGPPSVRQGILTILAGTGISVTGSGTSRTITNTGVTAVAATSPVTTSAATGSITLGLSTVPIASGGTGATTALGAFNALSPLTTRGDLLTRDATNNVRLALGASGRYLYSDGTDASWRAPVAADIGSGAALTTANDTNVTLTAGGSAASALLASASVTAGWSGQLAISRGGTGQATATAAFDALSPMSALGDLIYGGAAGTRTRLGPNTTTTKKFLTMTGDGVAGAAPTWETIAVGDVGAFTATSITGTAAQILANGTSGSAQTGAVTLTFPASLSVTTSVGIGAGPATTGALRLTKNQYIYTDDNVGDCRLLGFDTANGIQVGNNCAGGAGIRLNGALTVTGASIHSSTLAVTGDVAVNTNKFNVTAASGNTTVAGTLGVTGAATLSSSLDLAGLLTGRNNTAWQQKDSGGTLRNMTLIDANDVWNLGPMDVSADVRGGIQGRRFSINSGCNNVDLASYFGSSRHGLLIIIANFAGSFGAFYLQGGGAAVTELLDPAGIWFQTNGANNYEIYWSAGTSYKIQNCSGTNRDFQTYFFPAG